MGDEPVREKQSIYVYANIIKELEAAMKPRREAAKADRRGGRLPGPSTLASELFEAAWPLFQHCGFDKERVAEAVAPLVAPRKKGNLGR